MRSPYAYLAMDRYVAMTQDYNLKINLRLIYPVAIRDAQFFLKAPNYRYLYDPHDMAREAKFRGIRYRWPVPDPVVMDNKALKVADHADQPHIFRLYRIGALLQLEHEDKAVAWIHRMFCLIWDGSTDNWQDLISGRWTRWAWTVPRSRRGPQPMKANILTSLKRTRSSPVPLAMPVFPMRSFAASRSRARIASKPCCGV